MKYNNTLLALALAAYMAVSCADKKETEEAAATAQDSTEVVQEQAPAAKPLALEMFSTFPPEVNGCSCYFSENKEDFNSQKYVFASNFGQDAFLKIDGEMAKFTLAKTDSISPNGTRKTYNCGDLQMIIDMEKTGGLEEVWYYKGALKITRNNNEVYNKELTGECGC